MPRNSSSPSGSAPASRWPISARPSGRGWWRRRGASGARAARGLYGERVVLGQPEPRRVEPGSDLGARAAIGKEFGERYLPEKPRFYSTKAKNAQEAHEAIRPTDFSRTPAAVRKYLDADQARLYEIVWKRAIASQMQSAEIERTTVEIEAVNGARQASLHAWTCLRSWMHDRHAGRRRRILGPRARPRDGSRSDLS